MANSIYGEDDEELGYCANNRQNVKLFIGWLIMWLQAKDIGGPYTCINIIKGIMVN